MQIVQITAAHENENENWKEAASDIKTATDPLYDSLHQVIIHQLHSCVIVQSISIFRPWMRMRFSNTIGQLYILVFFMALWHHEEMSDTQADTQFRQYNLSKIWDGRYHADINAHKP